MLKLKRFTEGQWFDYPKAEGVRFKILPLSLSDGLKIRSKIRDRVPTELVNPQSKKKEKITTLMEDVDTAKFTWEIFDYILQDFDGIQIEGPNGEIVGSTKEELKRAIFDDRNCREFISEKSESLLGDNEVQLEEETKN